MTDSDEVKLLPCEPLLESVKASLEDVFYDTLNCGFDADLLARAAIEAYESTRPPVVTDEVVERVARAIALSDYSSENIVWPGDFSPQERIDYYDNARAAIASMPAVVSGGECNILDKTQEVCPRHGHCHAGMAQELIERLRAKRTISSHGLGTAFADPLCEEAADALQSQSARIAELREALTAAKPLVNSYADHADATDAMVRSSNRVSNLIQRALEDER